MKYSIIVPIYKVEQFLDQCVKSVINQTYSDWELILVDDGSPDNCPQICDSYAQKDNRIKVVHKKNGGLVSARKAGLEIATGEYSICLDGDDFLHEECLLTVDNVIEQYSPDVVCFGHYGYNEGSIKNRPLTRYLSGFYDRERMRSQIFPRFLSDKNGLRFPSNLWGKVFKTDIYKIYQMKVDSAVSMGEDSACVYPLIANAKSLFILEDCLYYYRNNTSSMSKVKRPLSWDNYDLVEKIRRENMNCNDFDFQKQAFRLRTHNLFNIVLSQFYGPDSYISNTKKIKDRFLQHPEYDVAIENSDFESHSYKFMRFVLKNKLYFVCYLYSLIK